MIIDRSAASGSDTLSLELGLFRKLGDSLAELKSGRASNSTLN